MRFLLDANLPRSAVACGAATGDDVLHVHDIGLSDATDADIFDHVQRHGLILITRDLDFADVRAYPPASGPGVVVLRLPEDAVAHRIVAVLRRLLAHREIVERLPGRLAIVDEARVRVRPPIG